MPNSGHNGEWFSTTDDYWDNLQAASGPILAWQLWYEHALCICSRDVRWDDAETDGVQALVTHHPGGRRNLTTGRDEYTFPGETSSKLGLMIGEQDFSEIVSIALADTWRP